MLKRGLKMIKVFDYIKFRQPEIVEYIIQVGLLAASFRVMEQSEFTAESELTAEQKYLDRLMRQRPVHPGVVFYRY